MYSRYSGRVYYRDSRDFHVSHDTIIGLRYPDRIWDSQGFPMYPGILSIVGGYGARISTVKWSVHGHQYYFYYWTFSIIWDSVCMAVPR